MDKFQILGKSDRGLTENDSRYYKLSLPGGGLPYETDGDARRLP